MFAENDMVEKSMQESRLDIICYDLVVMLSCQSQDDADTSKFGDRCIGRAIVLRALTETCYNKGLILCHNDKPYSICLFCSVLSYPLCKVGIRYQCLSLFKVDQAF